MSTGVLQQNSSVSLGTYRRKEWSGSNGTENFCNPYHMVDYSHFNPSVEYAFPNQYAPGGHPGIAVENANYVTSFGVPALLPVNLPAAKVIDVLNSLSESIKGHSLDLGQAMAELDKTLHSVATLASALKDLTTPTGVMRALKVTFGRTRRDRPGDLASAWLRHKYEIKPLVEDVYDAVGALKSKMKPTYHIATARTSHDVSDEDTSSTVGTLRRTSKVSLHVDSRVTIPIPIMAELGLNNPAGFIWERIPFSFVVDWVIPIGPWLAAAAFPFALYSHNVRYLYRRTASLTYRYDLTTISGEPYTSSYWIFGPAPFVKEVELVRTPALPGLPLPIEGTRGVPKSFSSAVDKIVTTLSLLTSGTSSRRF